ncbi:MAG: division/cell wall cluster transcriptional repressor MraZ [Pseudomonadota bacterium]
MRAAEASFLGSQTNRIDAKGRIAVPADFRRALDLKSFNGFFCIPSLEGAFLDCGGTDYITSLKASISALDPFDPDRRALEVTILGRAKAISLDSEGRFVLPEPFRQHAMLEDKAFFIGIGDTFQIWRAQEAEDTVENQTERARAALMRLKNPSHHANGGGV